MKLQKSIAKKHSWDEQSYWIKGLPADKWLSMSDYYSGSIHPAGNTFWTDCDELELLSRQGFSNIVSLALKLGTLSAEDRFTLLKIPTPVAVDLGCYVPFELDAIDYKAFFSQPLNTISPKGKTLDLTDIGDIKPGSAEYVVKGVEASHVEFMYLQYEVDEVRKVRSERALSMNIPLSGSELFEEVQINAALLNYFEKSMPRADGRSLTTDRPKVSKPLNMAKRKTK